LTKLALQDKGDLWARAIECIFGPQ